MRVGKVIYDILSNDENVTKYVSNKIFPIVADLGTTFPFLIYRRGGLYPQYTKDMLLLEVATINIVVASEEYDESVKIAEAVRAALDCKQGTYNGIKLRNIYLEDAYEDYVDNTFIQNLTFKITIYGL